jgi:hypothetical protein
LFNSSVLTVAVVYGLLLWLAGMAGLFGLMLEILLLSSLWRYSYVVLRHIAQGRKHIPSPDVDTLNPVSEWRLVVHLSFFVLALILFATTPLFGDGAPAVVFRSIGVAVVVAVFPASAALMGFTGNPAAALNPLSIAGVIATFGPSYWKLVLACVALTLFAGFVPGVLAPSGNSAVLALCEIASVWALLGVFAMVGGALNDRRDDFDIPGVRAAQEEWRKMDRERDWQRTLDRAYGSIRSGLPAEGYRAIKVLITAENESIEIYQWVFNAMLGWQDQTHALRIAARFVERLLDAGREQGALDLADQCRKLSPEFVVPAPSAARLADYARTIGRHGVADEIVLLSRHAPSP